MVQFKALKQLRPKQGAQGISKQSKGLPSSVYVEAHLLQAMNVANKMIQQSWAKFGYTFFSYIAMQKADLDTCGSRIKLSYIQKGDRKLKQWQNVQRSKLYDLEKEGKVSSDLKRRSLTKKGGKRFFDAIILLWFVTTGGHFLPWSQERMDNKGTRYRSLELENSSSPFDYRICFKVEDMWYLIYLNGNKSANQKRKRKVGRTSSLQRSANVPTAVQDKGSSGSSLVKRLQAEVLAKAAAASAGPSNRQTQLGD